MFTYSVFLFGMEELLRDSAGLFRGDLVCDHCPFAFGVNVPLIELQVIGRCQLDLRVDGFGDRDEIREPG